MQQHYHHEHNPPSHQQYQQQHIYHQQHLMQPHSCGKCTTAPALSANQICSIFLTPELMLIIGKSLPASPKGVTKKVMVDFKHDYSMVVNVEMLVLEIHHVMLSVFVYLQRMY
ncbi:MAG: hypothetical protein ACI8RD_006225 [Bacillariaceae sp.]|jgi:hypothetical protein